MYTEMYALRPMMFDRRCSLASDIRNTSAANRHDELLTRQPTYANIGHAFQKKSKAGIATPKSEIELVRQRLKHLRTEMKNAKTKSS